METLLHPNPVGMHNQLKYIDMDKIPVGYANLL